jgi:hypothetical protein
MDLGPTSVSSLWQRIETFALAHDTCGAGIEFADGHILVVVRCAGCGASKAFEGSAEGDALNDVGVFIQAIREWRTLDQSSKH